MRRFIAAVIVGGTLFGIYLAADSTPASAVNRVATCPVRIDDDCLARAIDGGFDVHRYERLRFPVVRTVLPDGGVEFDLPQAMLRTNRCVEVLDWTDCAIDATATFPVAAGKWDAGLPFVLATNRKCVRPRRPALQCLRLYPDGGAWDFGDRNVYPRTEASNPADCEPVECVVYAGEDPEVHL